MSEKILKGRLVQKHDVEANWELATNFIPKQGEVIVYDIDENYNYERIKIGDGTTNVNDLPFIDDAMPHTIKEVEIINIARDEFVAKIGTTSFNKDLSSTGVVFDPNKRYVFEFMGERKLGNISEQNYVLATFGDISIQITDWWGLYLTIYGTITESFTDLKIYELEIVELDNACLEKDVVIQNSISISRKGEIGGFSSALGFYTEASGEAAHSEGNQTKATGSNAHAEGRLTTASGVDSHVEGYNNIASGDRSHVEGSGNIASGEQAHAEGLSTLASSANQHVQGIYNIEDATNTYAHIVGNGNYGIAPSNAHTLDWEGNAWFAGDVYVGSTSGTNKDEGSKKLASEEYVDNAVANAGGSQPDWNQNDETAKDYIKNKPFGETTVMGDTLTWDGNTEGLEVGTLSDPDASFTSKLFRISDTTPTFDELVSNGVFITLGHGGVEEIIGRWIYNFGDKLTDINGYVYVAYDDDTTVQRESIIFSLPKKGVYVFAHSTIDLGENVVSITIPGYNGFETTETVTINPKYLPDSVMHPESEVVVVTRKEDDLERATYTSEDIYNLYNEGKRAVFVQGDMIYYLTYSEVYPTSQSTFVSIWQNRLYVIKVTGIGWIEEETLDIGSIEDANSKIEDIELNVDLKMDKANPVGTGSFSMNRKSGSVIGEYSHADGLGATASGNSSHAEGSDTIASGISSHSEGGGTIASGDYSHSEGFATIASSECQHVQGMYNIEDTSDIYSHIVGNGESDTARSNAHTLDWNGNAWFQGAVKIGGTSQDDATAKTLATTEDVYAVKNDLLNGAGAAYDTLKELGDLIDDNTTALEALEIVATSKADKSEVSALSTLVGDTSVATQISDAMAQNPAVQIITWEADD